MARRARAGSDGAVVRLPPITELAEGRLFGAFYGALPPKVVGLHGWGRTHRDFDPVFEGMPALAVDLPGFGASPRPPGAWGSSEYADLLSEALEEIGGHFVFVGHSFGGRIALRLAERHPEMVVSLILTGTPLIRLGGRRKVSLRYRVARGLARLGAISESRLEALKRRYGSSDYRAAVGVMRDVLVRVVNEDYSDLLVRIGCDVRLVWGAEDQVVPPEVARRALGSFPSARLTVLDGHDHYSVLNAPHLRESVREAEAELDFPRPRR